MHADTVVGEIVSLTIGSTVVGLMYGDQWRLADCDVYLDGLSERLGLAVARAVGSRCRAPGPGARHAACLPVPAGARSEAWDV